MHVPFLRSGSVWMRCFRLNDLCHLETDLEPSVVVQLQPQCLAGKGGKLWNSKPAWNPV